jgi:hypothetical protein
MWKVGDRILARRRPETYWYPGTVRDIDGTLFLIQFDDGDEGVAVRQEMLPCRFEAGDRVGVYQAASGDYLTATVVQPDDAALRVRYMNQEEQAVPLSKIRIQPDLWKQPQPSNQPAVTHSWSVCDRVLACWLDLDWYPGIVLASEPNRLHILFDTGAQGWLPPARIRPFQFAAGDRIMCRRQGDKDYYTGMLTDVTGEKIQVRYDDGSEETTSARLLRFRRDEWLPSGSGQQIPPGTRVLAQGFDLYWYPGRVVAIDGRRVQVRFAEGNQGLVAADQIRPLDISVGSRVYCRRGAGPDYFPGMVMEQDVDRIRVVYDGGGEEITSVRLVRVER